MPLQVDFPALRKPHPLGLKHRALHRAAGAAGGSRRDFPLRVDDAMPGNVILRAQRMHRVANLPRVPRKSRQRGDLAVIRHAPARDHPRDAINRLVRRMTRGTIVDFRFRMLNRGRATCWTGFFSSLHGSDIPSPSARAYPVGIGRVHLGLQGAGPFPI